MEKVPWWGGGAYKLGGRASPHVAGEGITFLRQHRQPGPVADFATWEGRNIPALLSLGGRVIATDTPAAREALQRTRRKFPSVRCHEATLGRLPLPTGKVGGALCWRVLHNLTAPGELISAFAEINRVLALEAPLVVAVRSEHQTPPWASQRAFVRHLPNGNGGVRADVYFTRGAFEIMSDFLGFRVEHTREDVEGGEEIDGKAVTNRYLVAHLLKVGAPSATHQDVAERLVVRP